MMKEVKIITIVKISISKNNMNYICIYSFTSSDGVNYSEGQTVNQEEFDCLNYTEQEFFEVAVKTNSFNNYYN